MADGSDGPQPGPSGIKFQTTSTQGRYVPKSESHNTTLPSLSRFYSSVQQLRHSPIPRPRGGAILNIRNTTVTTQNQQARNDASNRQTLLGTNKFYVTEHKWSTNTQKKYVDFTRQQRLKARGDHGSEGDSRHGGLRGRGRGDGRGRGRDEGHGGVLLENRRRRHPEKKLQINTLQEIIEDDENILLNVYTNKGLFTKLFKSKLDDLGGYDTIVLIIKIISCMSQTIYEQTRKKLVIDMDIRNSGFMDVLSEYLIDLPTLKEDTNPIYFTDPNQFWENFFNFCECLLDASPSFATKLRTLLEATVRRCLQALAEERAYALSDVARRRMDDLCNKLQRDRANRVQQTADDGEPPEIFRELSVLPRRSELISSKPFLRPNIVQGGYASIEHYLDVQFRLLREDCYGPLRDGIFQYMREPSKKKYDSIRVYHNVTFVGVYVSDNKVGYAIQLDRSMNRFLQKINWAHSKRFIYGSLLLLTKDNCKSLIVATVLDRDERFLMKGQIPITINIDDDEKLDTEASYTMIESEVYFEPYFHVLNALKNPKFPNNLAMSKYIVNVDPNPTHPSYLKENTQFTVAKKLNLQELDLLCNEETFTVLNDDTWPSHEYLGLNESQYRAYRLALTREFAVIQGPPGTGKTFLGVKVAQTLLLNLENSTFRTKMLVICFTNHALDQFLEALLPVTRSIVRVGGQSKNEAIMEYNINKLRRDHQSSTLVSRMFRNQKNAMKLSLLAVKMEYEKLERIRNSVLGLKTVIKYVPDATKMASYGKYTKDPLMSWLFQNLQLSDPWTIVLRYSNNKNDIHVNDDLHRREDVTLNEFFSEDDYKNYNEMDKSISVTFSVQQAEEELMSLISDYKVKMEKNKNNKTNVIYELESRMIYLDGQVQLFKNMSNLRREDTNYNISDVRNLNSVPLAERWKMYFSWLEIVLDDIKAKIKPLEKPLEFEKTLFEEVRMMMDLEIIKQKQVIGMTTTGAARLRTMLQEISAPIVIVEEAAEVLEAHIVTSLTQHCKHLILIGDHQQLRPSAAYTRLARHYNIEVSLFERMILNGVHSCQLTVQHRMRPEIAALISPHIYRELHNHESVELFPNVRGMATNLFFFTHDHIEEDVEDSASRSNHAEADMVLALANYLMLQDYKAEDITILAAYSGQMFYLRTQRKNYWRLSNVKITVVDNYQGEESKIILLSLVRNNGLKKIGFLGTANRVCVALSRAREGFYIFGNKNILKDNSELWRNILETLEENENVGAAFKLKCDRHPFKITEASTVSDFDGVPEGGCTLNCDKKLKKCGHQCPLTCHGYDEEHTIIECNQKCERNICSLDHPCPLRCKEKCLPCKVLVVKKLRCGHEQEAPCHKPPGEVYCMTTVTVVLELCKHEVQKRCYMPVEKVRCPVPCDVRVNKCGHSCARNCHLNNDPDHLEYVCEKPCARAKANCSLVTEGDRGEHQCPKKCHEPCDDCKVQISKKRSTCKHAAKVPCSENIDLIPCKKKCARSLPCGHFCKKLCNERCGDCKEMVIKELPDCKHKMKMECRLEPTATMCEKKCERTLPCGHACVAKCGEPCGTRSCTVPEPQPYRAPCGHQVYLPCSLYKDIQNGKAEASASLGSCAAACGVVLACGHACGGSCGRCRRASLHEPCTQRCEKTHLCGHRCKEPCSALCPPCSQRCEVRCPHSRCGNRCGAPCTPCEEPCSRVCPHGSCSRRCDEPCSRKACAEPCVRVQPCSHPCAGLCGEPCPPVCRHCDPDKVPVDFLGDPYDDDARFIQLKDCGHVVEANDLQNWVQAKLDDKEVTLPPCPLCRTPILNTPRYRDVVNALFRRYINPVKSKLYGTRDVILQRKEEVKIKIAKTIKYINTINNKQWTAAIKKIYNTNPNSKVSLLEIDMQLASLDILDILGEYHDEYLKNKLTHLKTELHEYISIICKVVEQNFMKLSEQQQLDIQNEIRRVHCVIQLAKIFDKNFFNKDNSQALEAAEVAKSAVFTILRFDEEVAMDAMKHLQEIMKMDNVITTQEREMIVKAMGGRLGHWYKCPNGHVYYIGDCGGASEIGRCNECGAQVGGTGHRLLSTNRHAGEMDGSQHAAWSDAANMNNYDLR